jgi:Domain of unknown function (DUF222)/HNH endonuclease
VCDLGQQAGVAGLLTSVTDALARLAGTDMTALTTAEQAECLRALAGAESRALAVRSAVLAAFDADRGYEDDAAGGSRSWLRWQTRATTAAAAGAVGWMRRLRAHPRVAAALAAGTVSPSWARQVCDWTDPLDQDRDAGDQILLAAAAGGAQLADLAGLAEEIRARTAVPDTDPDGDGFRDRSLRLSEYWHGNGQLAGDLTPDCAAALRAVLDALGAKAGPEDLRSQDQRDHDALQEALQRLIAARYLPERGGQPTTIQLHMTLDQLLGRDGADTAIADWAGYGAGAPPGADCDATIVPVVTGHLDPDLLHQLAATLLPAVGREDCTSANSSGGTIASGRSAASCAPDPGIAARELILTRATRLLAGPYGLAAWLRTRLTTGPAATISQPLDIGIPTEVIPPHLRRAVILRDRHCAFPGCHRLPAGCHVHHIVPRSEGGVTSLGNCVLLCPFHHLIAIHRWGWHLRLNPDSTTTATSPDGARTLHSHSPPPGQVA